MDIKNILMKSGIVIDNGFNFEPYGYIVAEI
jgi:hypothetical protein